MAIRTTLYFGSFNPIHKGHTTILRHILEHGYCDDIMVIVSAQSPFKSELELAPEVDRFAMVKCAIEQEDLSDIVTVSNIEMTLPKPSYTINTLRALEATEPNREFSILMGEDNIVGLSRWKDGDYILNNYRILVYPREGRKIMQHNNITVIKDIELLPISSTQIRSELSQGCRSEWLHENVFNYIKDHKLWI